MGKNTAKVAYSHMAKVGQHSPFTPTPTPPQPSCPPHITTKLCQSQAFYNHLVY